MNSPSLPKTQTKNIFMKRLRMPSLSWIFYNIFIHPSTELRQRFKGCKVSISKGRGACFAGYHIVIRSVHCKGCWGAFPLVAKIQLPCFFRLLPIYSLTISLWKRMSNTYKIIKIICAQFMDSILMKIVWLVKCFFLQSAKFFRNLIKNGFDGVYPRETNSWF